MRKALHGFPTAKDEGFALALNSSAGAVSGATVRVFLLNVVRLIDSEGVLENLAIPFCTSGSNYLVSRSPKQPTGEKFVNYFVYKVESSGDTLYVNINHPRFFALRQGARLLEAAGFKII